MLVLIVLIGSILAGGAWFIKQQYKAKQETIKKAIAELPKFDEVAVSKEIAKEHGFPFPVPEPSMTDELILQQAKKETEELLNKKYSVSEFNKEQSKILKKYRVAKNGDQVSFILNTTGETITGVFKGAFKDYKGRYIKVGIHEYRLPDIMEDYRYLFDSAIASQTASNMLRALKNDFKLARHKFQEKTFREIKERLYKTSGYSKLGNKWISNREFLQNELEKRLKAYQKKIDIATKKIYEENKLFGVIDVNIIPLKEEGSS